MTITRTTNFGLIAVKDVPPSTNDWAATYWNWIAADAIMYASAISHKHDGAIALQNPIGTLALTTATSGGYLKPNILYYIAITYVDNMGRETAASVVANITTGAGITTPVAPTINDDATPTDIQYADIGLVGGDYWYKIAYKKGGGETLPSLPVYVSIPTDTTYECTIHFASLADIANDADTIVVYRKIGTGNYVKLAEITETSTDYYTDDNTGIPTCDVGPKTVSTINSLNTITVDWSALDYTEAEKVRIYVTTTSGVYSVNSLVTEINMHIATPATSYLWTGLAGTVGKPPEVTQCFPSPSKIALATEVQGILPWANLPTDLLWKEPVDTFASLPISPTESECHVVQDEGAIYVWDESMATPVWNKMGGINIYEGDHPDINDVDNAGKIWICKTSDGTYVLEGRFDGGQVALLPLRLSGYGQLADRIGYLGYWEDGDSNDAPWYGYGAIRFNFTDKKFEYYDDTIATPAWIAVT